jgi:glycosyltransferase involved in cell wall biosynthesis
MQSEKLRIAFGTSEYVTERHFDGGLANYLNRVTRTLADVGHDVHVVTLSQIDAAEFDHKGVMVHRVLLKDGWDVLSRATRYRLPTTLHWLNLSAQVYRKLKQLKRDKPFDLVQFPNYSFCGLVSMLLLRTPHVLRLSSLEPFLTDPAKRRTLDFKLLELMENFQFRLSPYICAPSRSLQQMVGKRNGLSRVRLIHNPMYLEIDDLDDALYKQLLQDKQYLLFFGRFEPRKGFHILAQALARVFESSNNFHAVLVGRDVATTQNPSMAEYVKSECSRFGDRLIVLSSLSHQHLYPIIAKAKLVVVPSLVDNLPNASLEAMALGKVVIGTREAGLDEVISDEETGFLVPANSVNALAEKIIYAWTHPRLQEIGNAARQKIQDFSPENTTAALLGYYREILQR